jgi:hypothetical protein
VNTPNWFYKAARERIAGHIGADATQAWVRSRFLYAFAWVLAIPIGLASCLRAELSGPWVLWGAAAAAWIAAALVFARSMVAATTANRLASAHLSKARAYRTVVSCPITMWEWQWQQAFARAEREHIAHMRLAETDGAAGAIDQLVERKRYAQGLSRVALGLAGFLAGFVIGLVLAFAAGQTESLGVFLVFILAIATAFAVPLAFRSRFTRAVANYRADISRELLRSTQE